MLNGAIWLGGTVFMMLVLNPLWAAAPPASVRAYWVDGRLFETIFNYFGPPWQVARLLPLIGACIACWPSPRHRRWLGMAVVAWSVGVAMTVTYIYPMNETLFTAAIDDVPDGAARAMTHTWLLADRARFAIMTVGILSVFQAFRLPLDRT